MKIRAAVMRAVGAPVAIEELELDPPQAGEVLVRIVATGLCGSDLHVVDGGLPEPLPLVLGHEAAGVVEALGEDVSGLAEGDHVVLSLVPACGACHRCRGGRTNLCETSARMAATGTLLDGTSRLHAGDEVVHHFNSVSSFATHAVVPAAGAVRVHPDLDLEAAALLSCALLTGTGAVFNTAGVPAGATVVVIGCGGVGLSVVTGARIAGAARIVAVDPRPASLELALAAGATDTVGAAPGSLVEQVRSLLPAGADYVFEAVGSAPTIEDAWALTAAGGTAVVVGLPPKGTAVAIDTWGFIAEKRLLGCFMGSANPAVDIPRLADLIKAGEIRPDSFAVTRISLAELPAVIASAAGGAGGGGGGRYLVVERPPA